MMLVFKIIERKKKTGDKDKWVPWDPFELSEPANVWGRRTEQISMAALRPTPKPLAPRAGVLWAVELSSVFNKYVIIRSDIQPRRK